MRNRLLAGAAALVALACGWGCVGDDFDPDSSSPPVADAAAAPLEDAALPPEDSGGGSSVPAVLTTEPPLLDFGVVDVGQTATLALKVTNTGTVPIGVPVLAITPPVFTVATNGCQASLGVGADCTLEIAFAPSAFGIVAGGTLTLSEGATPIKQVLLKGTGRASHALTVAKAGTGTGTVTSTDDPPSIACGTDCSASLESAASAATLTLNATPSPDSSFAGWSGGCTGTGACTVTLDAAKTVTATFTRDKRLLHIVYVEDQPGAGALTSNVGGVGCAAGCDQNFYVPDDTNVTLTPPAGVAYRFSGDCTGVNGVTCTVALTQDRDVSVRVSRYNYAFVTSTTYTGDLGGLAGADDKCNARAAAAGLPGTFIAFLSAEGPPAVWARDRVTRSGGFIRTDKSIFARTAAELQGQLYRNPLAIDEMGTYVVSLTTTDGKPVWSGTHSTGAPTPNLSCESWTTSAPPSGGSCATGVCGHFGGTRGVRHRLMTLNAAFCSSALPLYCLGADSDAAVPLAAVPANVRRVFVTSTDYPANLAASLGGIGNYDAACQARAAAGNLGNTAAFAALMPSDTQSPKDRLALTTDTPWYGLDGVPLAATGDAFLAGQYLTGIQITELGTYRGNLLERVLTGYRRIESPLTEMTPSSAPQLEFQCNGWTSNDAAAQLGTGRTTDASWLTWTSQTSLQVTADTCAVTGPLFCIERTVRP